MITLLTPLETATRGPRGGTALCACANTVPPPCLPVNLVLMTISITTLVLRPPPIFNSACLSTLQVGIWVGSTRVKGEGAPH